MVEWKFCWYFWKVHDLSFARVCDFLFTTVGAWRYSPKHTPRGIAVFRKIRLCWFNWKTSSIVFFLQLENFPIVDFDTFYYKILIFRNANCRFYSNCRNETMATGICIGNICSRIPETRHLQFSRSPSTKIALCKYSQHFTRTADTTKT